MGSRELGDVVEPLGDCDMVESRELGEVDELPGDCDMVEFGEVEELLPGDCDMVEPPELGELDELPEDCDMVESRDDGDDEEVCPDSAITPELTANPTASIPILKFFMVNLLSK